MSSLNLRRFANVATLRKVHHDRLLSLLVPHEAYLRGRAVDFDNGGIDYVGLVAVLLKPDERFPLELADALHHINELATEDGMDDLLEAEVEELDDFSEQSGLLHAAHVKDIESLEQDQQWLLTAMWAICQHLEAECPTRGR